MGAASSSSSSGSSSSTTDNVVKLYQSENQTLQEENKQLKDRLDEEKEKYRVLEKDHKTAITDKTKLEKEVAAKEQDIKDLNSNNSAITARCQVITLDLSTYQQSLNLPTTPPLVLFLPILPSNYSLPNTLVNMSKSLLGIIDCCILFLPILLVLIYYQSDCYT